MPSTSVTPNSNYRYPFLVNIASAAGSEVVFIHGEAPSVEYGRFIPGEFWPNS
jgi:hypothetical protein